MKLVANYRGEEIPLKTYKTYYELDKELINFKSKAELMNKLGLVEDVDDIYVRINKDTKSDIDIDALRATLSFFEQGKNDQFVDWIYSSASKSKSNKNKTKMRLFFSDRLLDFTKGDENFSINNINNAEGKSVYLTIKNTIKQIEMFGFREVTNKHWAIDYVGRQNVIDQLRAYVKRNGIYDYVAMRNFATKLTSYKFDFAKPNVELIEINKEKQANILESYMTPIHNYAYSKKQITLDELTEDKKMNSVYDENGVKVDEKEFLEEFAIKKNLHL